MDKLEGTIAQVVFNKPSKWDPSGHNYVILRLKDGTTVKGKMSNPRVGGVYCFWGELRPQKNGYPAAFEFEQQEALCDKSGAGIAKFLAMHIDGIGIWRADSLVKEFGDETLTVLRTEPEKALAVKGITDEHVANIKTYFETSRWLDPVAYGKLLDMFADYKIPKKAVKKLLHIFGSDAPEKVKENPYILADMPRIGWKTCDSFALEKAAYDRAGLSRHMAAYMEGMSRITADGHTCATEGELESEVAGLLGMPPAPEALAKLLQLFAIVKASDDHGVVYQPGHLADDEAIIAQKLKILMAAQVERLDDFVTDEWAKECGLKGKQIEAAKFLAKHPVAILCGAPGVGKTYTLARVLGRMREKGINLIRVAAPTGKAAKRAKELLEKVRGCGDIPSTTIHKMLGPTPSIEKEGIPEGEARFGRGREGFTFSRDEGEPLEEHVVVIDESSMVDVSLCASLLRAIKPGTRVIFVGDHNQLPSVGPGSVLRDMMDAGIPTIELTEILRSDGGGTVVRACHAIKDGQIPQDADSIDLPTHNWIHIEIEHPDAIAAKIVELHATCKRFDKKWEMQVVSPQKAKLPIGCENLNALLARQLNPDSYLDTNLSFGYDEEPDGLPFRRGDKIIRKKNGVVDELVEFRGPRDPGDKQVPDLTWRGTKWIMTESMVVNGDMGEVLDVLLDKKCMIIEFRDPSRVCRLPIGEHHCLPAYAITVHSAQGSDFPYVIAPVHHSYYWDAAKNKGLFSRELFYTGISRASQLLVTVGQRSAIAAAVGRKTVHRRRTLLRQRLLGTYRELSSLDIDRAFECDSDLVTADVADEDDDLDVLEGLADLSDAEDWTEAGQDSDYDYASAGEE